MTRSSESRVVTTTPRPTRRPATRLVAAAVDIGLLVAAYSIASTVFASVIPFTFGGHLSTAAAIVLTAVGVTPAGGIIVAFWTLVGQTPGMRFRSIRLVARGSRHITVRCAIRRLLAVILSLVPLGLGFLAILRDRERRAWRDRIAGTDVIYDALARTAPHARRDADGISDPLKTPSRGEPRLGPRFPS
jgi:uncharacterized RDD family membrane protein YckC